MWIAAIAVFEVPGGEEEAVGKAVQEVHHLLPQEKALKAIFDRLGIDIEQFTIRMSKADHRLRPNGLHTNGGGNWNKIWREFLREPNNQTVPRIMRQLEKMIKDFGIRDKGI